MGVVPVGAFAVCVRPWLHPLGVQRKELEIEIEIDLEGEGDGERDINNNREVMERQERWRRGLCVINPKMENSNEICNKYS